MIAVYILIGLAALLTAIAFLRVRVTAGYADYPVLFYQIGPLVIRLIDKDWISEDLTDHSKRDRWQAKRIRQIESEQKKGKAVKPFKRTYKAGDIKEMIRVVWDLVAGVLKYVRKYAFLDELRVRMLVATGDAAATGMLYGEMQNLFSAATALLDAIPDKRKATERIRLETECDFLAEQMEVDAEIRVTMRVWQALVTRSWYTKEIKKLWELMIRDPAGSTKEKSDGKFDQTAS